MINLKCRDIADIVIDNVYKNVNAFKYKIFQQWCDLIDDFIEHLNCISVGFDVDKKSYSISCTIELIIPSFAHIELNNIIDKSKNVFIANNEETSTLVFTHWSIWE